MKDILLISPDAKGLEDKLSYIPLGLLYVASNMGEEWNPTIQVMTDNKVYGYDYEFYGISVHSVAVVKEVRRLIKDILFNNHSAIIYIGGSAAELVQTDTNLTNIITVHGEGEKFFGVDTSDMDNIKFPARNLLPYEHTHYVGKVHHSKEASTTMIATRGCVYDCSFCDRVTHGRKFKKRSIVNVCNEIEQLIGDYEIKFIRFCDDCMTLDKKWLLKLCKAIKSYNIEWACMARADTLDNETLSNMKKAGCKEIYFGFESGSQKLLDLMNKKTTVKKNAEIIKKCKDNGITCCAYMMFGFPGEDEHTVEDTMEFLTNNKPDKSRISTFVPIPGTDVWNNPQKYNVEIKHNFEDFWYFDTPEFGLKYKYFSKDTTMYSLRNKIMSYYNLNYKQGWTK